MPPGLVEMLQISGLGVAKIRQIHEALDIDSLPELEAAARDGRLARLPRFGQKTAENILKGIAFLRQASAFKLAHHAAEEAEGLRRALAALPGVLDAVVAGDVRRRMEVVRDIVVVLVAEVAARRDLQADWAAARGARVRRPGRAAGHPPGERRSARPRSSSRRRKNVGAVLVQATGSDAHLAQLNA